MPRAIGGNNSPGGPDVGICRPPDDPLPGCGRMKNGTRLGLLWLGVGTGICAIPSSGKAVAEPRAIGGMSPGPPLSRLETRSVRNDGSDNANGLGDPSSGALPASPRWMPGASAEFATADSERLIAPPGDMDDGGSGRRGGENSDWPSGEEPRPKSCIMKSFWFIALAPQILEKRPRRPPPTRPQPGPCPPYSCCVVVPPLLPLRRRSMKLRWSWFQFCRLRNCS